MLPVALLSLSSEILAMRHIFIAIAGIYSAWRLTVSSPTLSEIGLHKNGFREALVALVLPSILLILSTYLVFELLPTPWLNQIAGYDSLAVIGLPSRLLAYALLSAPVQELVFRGYITWRIKQVYTSGKALEMFSVAIFTFAHLPFHSPLVLVVTFFMGIAYIRNWEKYHNLYSLIISHAIVGACLIVIRNAWFPY